MFTIAVVLTLFVMVDSFLVNLENIFSLEELTDMGICLDNSFIKETR